MHWRIFVGPLVSLLVIATALAQDSYPDRPVRLVVGLAAGSSTDVTARIVGRSMGLALGRPFVVENRPGAAGNVATGFVAHAPADGYTLLFGSAATTVNATLLPDAGFDLVKDLAPIALVAAVPNILVVHVSLGVKSVAELIAKARSQPNQIAYASSGIGSSPHLSAELFSMMAGVRLVHVPYKGSSEAMTDLIAGRTSLMFAPAPTALSQLPSNTLIALASTHLKRTRAAPDLATMDELGLKGFDTGVWFGLFAPAGTPKAIVDQLAHAANEAIASEEVRAAFAPQGIDAVGSTPEEFSIYVQSEIGKWAKLVDAAGLKP